MPPFPIDPDARVQATVFALVSSKRKNRKRFAEGCVREMQDEQSALAGHDPDHGIHAAVVYGPSFSSESQRVYHLVRWLC
jgi:hypothetical protein